MKDGGLSGALHPLGEVADHLARQCRTYLLAQQLGCKLHEGARLSHATDSAFRDFGRHVVQRIADAG